MNFLISTIIIFGLCLIPTITYPKDMEKLLMESITCGAEPLGRIRGIAEKGSDFKKGYSVMSYGDGYANTVIITLERPLELYGAKSFFVVGVAYMAMYFEFNGIVYAKFSGDYKKILTELSLVEAIKEDAFIGKYQRKLNVGFDGKPYDTCPMTIGLTPLQNNEFLLGCGWCNG